MRYQQHAPRPAQPRSAVQDVDDITIALSGKDTISMAMEEIVNGDISFDHEKYHDALGHQPTAYQSISLSD